jgi:hypothetical protein
LNDVAVDADYKSYNEHLIGWIARRIREDLRLRPDRDTALLARLLVVLWVEAGRAG